LSFNPSINSAKSRLWFASPYFMPDEQFIEGLMHPKGMLIDDGYCTIGTASFDNRSFRLNFEVTMVFADEDFSA